MSTQYTERLADGSKSRTWRWLHGQQDPRWGVDPSHFHPPTVHRAASWLDRFFGETGRYPVGATGLDAIPASPLMFVSNHSGGSTVLDCLGLAYAWYAQFETRPLHFLAHEILLATRLTGPFFDRVGVLRTSRRLAAEVLSQWRRDVIVMPGGDRDTWRPYRDRYRVQFAGHTGYARLALQTGVRVVPVANAGPHETLLVLTDGLRIARALKLHELFRIDVFPIHLSLPWVVGIGPLPHLPVPAPLRYSFGRAVPLPEGPQPIANPSAALVLEYDRRVREALQQLLDEHAAQRNGL